ncbi:MULTISPECIES: hypothetical protein [unclassified Pseudoclavibacter]|uniref:hypothetical protein n=1 Tax=unclassified Pseudoclavibacter TaxID=2615177 RepID=UPI001BA84C98|nr:hypothetical protein [Pseudoclavibacter sp. Marseille-Q4354]MBS3177200.1 hypothetical protein [Pseudoclavibacter sp. Marseille-Q4354]
MIRFARADKPAFPASRAEADRRALELADVHEVSNVLEHVEIRPATHASDPRPQHVDVLRCIPTAGTAHADALWVLEQEPYQRTRVQTGVRLPWEARRLAQLVARTVAISEALDKHEVATLAVRSDLDLIWAQGTSHDVGTEETTRRAGRPLRASHHDLVATVRRNFYDDETAVRRLIDGVQITFAWSTGDALTGRMFLPSRAWMGLTSPLRGMDVIEHPIRVLPAAPYRLRSDRADARRLLASVRRTEPGTVALQRHSMRHRASNASR